MKTIISIIVLVAFQFIVHAQTTFHMIDGETFTVEKYNTTKTDVVCNGKSYDKSEVFYLEKNGKKFVFSNKNGKMFKIKLNEDPESTCGKGNIYAYKYFNSKIVLDNINLDDKSLLNDEQFRECYTNKVKQIKTSNTIITVVAAAVVIPLLVVSGLRLANTISVANSLP